MECLAQVRRIGCTKILSPEQPFHRPSNFRAGRSITTDTIWRAEGFQKECMEQCPVAPTLIAPRRPDYGFGRSMR